MLESFILNQLTAPHLNILRIQHQSLHPGIQVRERVDELLWCSPDVPPVLAEIIDRSRVETVAANHLAITTWRHNNLVNSKAAPVLDGFVGDVIFQAEGAQFISADDAAVAA